jgi:hypothetical protein
MMVIRAMLIKNTKAPLVYIRYLHPLLLLYGHTPTRAPFLSNGSGQFHFPCAGRSQQGLSWGYEIVNYSDNPKQGIPQSIAPIPTRQQAKLFKISEDPEYHHTLHQAAYLGPIASLRVNTQ